MNQRSAAEIARLCVVFKFMCRLDEYDPRESPVFCNDSPNNSFHRFQAQYFQETP